MVIVLVNKLFLSIALWIIGAGVFALFSYIFDWGFPIGGTEETAKVHRALKYHISLENFFAGQISIFVSYSVAVCISQRAFELAWTWGRLFWRVWLFIAYGYYWCFNRKKANFYEELIED